MATGPLISSDLSRMFRTGARDKGEVFTSFTMQANSSVLSVLSIPFSGFYLKDTHTHTYYMLIVTRISNEFYNMSDNKQMILNFYIKNTTY